MLLALKLILNAAFIWVMWRVYQGLRPYNDVPEGKEDVAAACAWAHIEATTTGRKHL